MAEISNRKDWVDFGKGVLMILVYLYHGEVIVGDAHSWSWWFAPFFLTGFFFLSGYLYTSDIKNVVFSSKLKQIFRAILVPYLIFMSVMFLPKVLFLNGFDSKQQLIDIVMFKASWFVVVIGVLQFIYALLIRIRPNLKFLAIMTGLLCVAGYVLTCFYDDFLLLVNNNVFIQSQELPNRLPLCLNIAMMMCPFFFLGILYRQYEKSIHYPPPAISWSMLGVIAVLYVGVMKLDSLFFNSSIVVAINTYDNILLVYGYALIGILLIVALAKRIGSTLPIVNYVGQNSLLCYYLNAVALRATGYLFGALSINIGTGYWVILCQTLVAVLLTLPVVWAINRYIPLLAGKKEAYNKLSQKLKLNIRW